MQQSPDGIAVRYRDRALSYAQLGAAAAAAAADLAGRGVGAGERVGICLERSPEAITAVLATLAAACTYVPLDPAHPRERLAAMARRAGVSAIITDEVCGARIGPLDGCPTMPLFLDQAADDPRRLGGQAGLPGGDRRPRPHDPAYVVFTSGSTSGPKPVIVSHAQILGLYTAWEATYRLREIATHLQMAAFGFDVFTGDLLRALLSGATLVISPQETTLDPAALYKLLRSAQIECAEFVPAVFLPLVRYVASIGQTLGCMKLCIVGSDRWTSRGYEAARTVLGPHTILVNSYGVTEAAVDSTAFLGTGHLPGGDQTVPIGNAFPGVDVHVVDDNLEPVTPGAIGQLAVGGVGVSYGYLGDPAMTAAKFVPDPFSGRPGSRLYLTGDAVRWTPGQGLELLGRLDEQLNVNGARIEPAEVEAALASHPDVQDAAVVAVSTGQDARQQLVGYVTPATPAGVDGRAVRRHVAGQLSPHAVPVVVVTGVLPLTANGKVDRQELRRRPLPPPARTTSLRPPAGLSAAGEARQIATIWREVLGLAEIGLDDNFYELGGQSIQAAQVVTRIRAVFGIPVPLWVMVETGSLGELAQWVQDAARERPVTQRERRSRPAISQDLEAADVVVTGGTGATGSFVVQALAQHGYAVAVAGRQESESSVSVAGATFVPVDLDDAAQLALIARHAKAIVHAACTFVTPAVDIAAMESLVGGWRRGPFVFISSTDVYGAPHQGIVSESDSPGPVRTAYAEAKGACEKILRAARQAGSRGPYTILRPAHVWGPHPRFRSQLLWGDLRWLAGPLAEGDAVRIPGPTPAAAQQYGDAWIDVRDLARAITQSLTSPSNWVINAVGGHFDWPGLAGTLRDLLGSASPIQLCDPAGCAQATSWRYSARLMGSVLGVTPRRRYQETLQEVLDQPAGVAGMLGSASGR